MTQTAAQQPAQPPPDLATVADVMRPPLTTADTNDHIAAAAYLMKHARATALTVLNTRTGRPEGILTNADIAHAVADGKDLNDLRIGELMTPRVVIAAMPPGKSQPRSQHSDDSAAWACTRQACAARSHPED